MKQRLEKLAERRTAVLAAMAAILTAAEATDEGTLSAEQTAKYAEHKTTLASLNTAIEEARALAAEFETAQPVRTATPGAAPVGRVGAPRSEQDPAKGFRSHRDFCRAVIAHAGLRDKSQIEDERLQPLAMVDKDDKAAAGELAFLLPAAFTPRSIMAAVGSDEQGAYSDPHGGYAVPTTRLPGVLSVGFEGDPTAGRTQGLPMETPSIEIMARTDKDHTTSVAGGFVMTRRPETVAAAMSRMQLEMITLKATTLMGLAAATEEILTDSPLSFAAIIAEGFRTQAPAHMLNEKIRGTGGNEYLGVLASPAKVVVAKESGQAADTIVAQNVINMAARCWGFDRSVFLANHDTRPQLATLSIPIGTGGVLLYQPSKGEGFPDMLWGRPVFYTEFCNTVGDEGDLILVDWSQYLEGIYQPLQSAESVHVRFVNHERMFKFWLRNAGAPWWRSALTPAKSSKTLSPIVTLAARA